MLLKKLKTSLKDKICKRELQKIFAKLLPYRLKLLMLTGIFCSEMMSPVFLGNSIHTLILEIPLF